MFGERLNFIRKKRGVTALEMSEYLSMGLRAYRNYESEDRFPSFPVLVKIADKLDISIDWLLGRDEYLRSHGVSVDEY